MGKILRVDLTNRDVWEEGLSYEIASNFIGGRGLNAYLIYKETDPRINPLSEENSLYFTTGPLTGTEFPGSGRIAVSSKSPLTNTIFDSSMGGYFGAYLKSVGYDAIIVRGKADEPTYLLIEEGRAKLFNADDLWGRNTTEVEEKLKKLYPQSSIAEIGPAGENLCHIAGIFSGTRTAGRGGLGAVMGSKKLKAIVVRRGGKRPKPVDGSAFKALIKKIRFLIENHPRTGIGGSLYTFGTAMLVHLMTAAGVIPIHNFSLRERLSFDQADNFSGETIREKYFIGRKGCYICPTGCGRRIRINDKAAKGPEYESIAMLGPNSGFFKFKEEIFPLSELCDELGIDTISAGGLIAMLREAGVIGSLEEAKQVLIKAAKGEEPYSKGTLHTARKLGKEELAMHVKGLDIPAYNPKGAKGIALAYATSNRGGCHLRAYTISFEFLNNPEFVDPTVEEGKALLVKRMQDAFAIFDSAIICKYYSLALFTSLNFELDDIAKALSAASGIKYSNEDLHEIGAKIYDVERLFNVKAGIGVDQDRLPGRFGVDLSRMLSEYYGLRGWVNGIPSEDRISIRKFERYKLGEIVLSPLKKIKIPQVQVALDLDADINTICKIALESYKGGARIIEAGTPALKRHGADKLIPALRRTIEDYCRTRGRRYEAIIVADMKVMDVGNLEARIAFRAGADAVVVLGIGSDNKIREALSEAIRRDKAIIVDLIQVEDPLGRLEDLVKKMRGMENWIAFCLHKGISEHIRSRGIYRDEDLIKTARKMAEGFVLSVAGGIKEGTAGKVIASGADICVVGSAIYNSKDPKETTKRILEEMRRFRSS